MTTRNGYRKSLVAKTYAIRTGRSHMSLRQARKEMQAATEIARAIGKLSDREKFKVLRAAKILLDIP